jgi:flagellar capping protein FliD
MAAVSLEMLQTLTQRVQDEQGSIREDIAKIRREMGRMSGRISLIERRLSTVLSTIRTGMETMADLNQSDTLAERVERLEEPRR